MMLDSVMIYSLIKPSLNLAERAYSSALGQVTYVFLFLRHTELSKAARSRVEAAEPS